MDAIGKKEMGQPTRSLLEIFIRDMKSEGPSMLFVGDEGKWLGNNKRCEINLWRICKYTNVQLCCTT